MNYSDQKELIRTFMLKQIDEHYFPSTSSSLEVLQQKLNAYINHINFERIEANQAIPEFKLEPLYPGSLNVCLALVPLNNVAKKIAEAIYPKAFLVRDSFGGF